MVLKIKWLHKRSPSCFQAMLLLDNSGGKNMISADKRGPMFGRLLRGVMTDAVWDGEYVHSECESWSGGRKKSGSPQSDTSLNAICLSVGHGFLTHTYFPSLSSKRPGVKM